jgi:hypothetical protein
MAGLWRVANRSLSPRRHVGPPCPGSCQRLARSGAADYARLRADLRLHALRGAFHRFAREVADERVPRYLRHADLFAVVRDAGEGGVGDPRGWDLCHVRAEVVNRLASEDGGAPRTLVCGVDELG